MAILQIMSALALRQVIGEGADGVGRLIGDWLGGPDQRLVRALHRANDNAWRALEIALAGESLWSRLDRAEARAFREQVRAFLDNIPLPELNGHADYRKQCLQELKGARKKGWLLEGLVAGELVETVGRLAAFGDPAAVLDAERNALHHLSDSLDRQGCTSLAWLVRQPARPGEALLVVAVRFFFRREVEADAVLSRGLVFAQVEELSRQQIDGFQKLDAALFHHGEKLTEALEGVSEGLVSLRDSVLDLREEVARQVGGLGEKIEGQLRSLQDQVLHLLEHFHLHGRPVRPGDSLSFHSDRERDLARELLRRYRALPEEHQKAFPALLNGLGKLQLAVGEFGAAQQSFNEAASLANNPRARAEAHHNAYRAALERRDHAAALAEFQQALALDPGRFDPFPTGEYEPLRLLGAGGFGVTFLCRHRLTGASVAIKSLSAEDLDRDASTVLHEAAALDQLNHPSIVRLRHCGFADAERKRPYLVMEYFDGPTLEEHVRAHGALPLPAVLEIASQVADALRAAHGQGILHRDVKPANVLVRIDSASRERKRPELFPPLVKLIDFGLALRHDILERSLKSSEKTVIGHSIAGTLEYAAPEQLGRLPGVRVGPPADVYGFARTMSFALFETPEPTYQDWQRIPTDLAELLGQCLARMPDRRPADFLAVQARLKQVGTAAPVAPRRETEVATPAVPVSARSIEEIVLPVLLGFLPQEDLHLAPDIPPRKLANACKTCQVPEDEQALALFDATVFGSAKNALVLGRRGLYYHNDWSSKQSGAGFVAYEEFPRRQFARESWAEVALDGNQFFNRSGSQVTSQRVVDILKAIQVTMSGRSPALRV